MSNLEKAQIKKFIDSISLYPDGSESQRRAMSEFNDFLQTIEDETYKSLFVYKAIQEVYYMNMLSGISTQMRGIFGVAVTTPAEMFVEAVKNPKLASMVTWGILKRIASLGKNKSTSVFSGVRDGAEEYLNIMKDGYVPMNAGLEQRGTITNRLINTKNKDLGAVGKVLKPYYYIANMFVRGIMAADALAHYTSREWFANVKAYNEILMDDKIEPKGKEMLQEITRRLHNSPAEKERAMDQALMEKQEMIDKGGDAKHFNVKTRAREIIQEARSKEIREFSEDKADRGRLAQKPEGAEGFIYKAFADAASKSPSFLIAPFLKISSNMISLSLDYSPWGFKRAKFGKGMILAWNDQSYKDSLRAGGKNLSSDDRATHIVKASIGTMFLLSIGALVRSQFDLDEDDEDKWFEVSGNGYGSYKKNMALRMDNKLGAGPDGSGAWQPYSYRFKTDGKWSAWTKYNDTPLALNFAAIGMANDHYKYIDNKKDQKILDMDMFQSMMSGALSFTTSQSYMQNIANFSKVVTGDGNTTDAIADLVLKVPKTLAYPNAYSQMVQTYDAITQRETDQPARYSDNLIRGIVERLATNVPIMRDIVITESSGDDKGKAKKAFDQFGYPIRRDLADAPWSSMIPSQIVQTLKSIEEEKYYNDKEAWDIHVSMTTTAPGYLSKIKEHNDITVRPEDEILINKFVSNGLKDYVLGLHKDYLKETSMEVYDDDFSSQKSLLKQLAITKYLGDNDFYGTKFEK